MTELLTPGGGDSRERPEVDARPKANTATGARTDARGEASEEAGSDPIGAANIPATLDEAERQLARDEAEYQYQPITLGEVRIEADRFLAGGVELRLIPETIRRLCDTTLGAPGKYIVSLPPDLQAGVLQTHFAERRFADCRLTDKTACAISRGGVLLTLGRTDLLTLGTRDLLGAVREGIGPNAADMRVRNLQTGNEAFTIDLLSPAAAAEVRPGDVISAGLRLEHSWTGAHATQVFAYVERLVCANGLVQRECLGPKGTQRSKRRIRRLSAGRLEARELQRDQVRRLVRDTWATLHAKLEAVRRLRDKPIQEKELEQFLRQARLFSRGLMARLQNAWREEGGEPTAFGALNALSRVATHARDLTAWQRRRLARLAGVYANQDVHLCRHCFSVLANR